MKKNVFLLLIGVVLVYIGVAICKTSNIEDIINVDTEASVIKHENSLSMMLETEANSGNYEMTTGSEWPTEGYVFNTELSKCENGGELSWDDENKRVLMSGNASDKCYVYFDLYNPTLAEYVISQYKGVQGNNNIYYHDSSLTNGAGDNSYRFAGSSDLVNNFVCFGSEVTPCPLSSLYRIIGVFNGQIKLILSEPATIDMLGTDGDYYLTSSKLETSYNGDYKNDNLNIGVYSWNANTSDIKWASSNLNNINLNQNFINYLTTNWSDKIATTTWKVTQNTFSKISVSSINHAYQNEMVNPESSTSYEAKIGLMYVSDYGYAATPTYWSARYSNYEGPTPNQTLDDNNYLENGALKANWLYKGVNEWSISTYSDSTGNPFFLPISGSMPMSICNLTVVKMNIYTRPTFYLVNNVQYKSGSGTKTDPIILGD